MDTLKIEGSDITIRSVGDHFCGKDVCLALRYEHPKQVIQNNVDVMDKRPLHELMDECTYTEGKAIYINKDGVEALLNRRPNHNVKLTVLKHLYSLTYGSGPEDIFSFINNHNEFADLRNDLNSDWFQQLWFALGSQTITPTNNCGSLEPKHGSGEVSCSNQMNHNTATTLERAPSRGPVQYGLILTSSLLLWLGYNSRKEADRVGKFKRLLDHNNLPYEEIAYDDPRTINYPGFERELMFVDKRVLHSKRWICMDVDSFKLAVLSITTKSSIAIKKYYIRLERFIFTYGAYTHNFSTQKALALTELNQLEVMHVTGRLGQLTITHQTEQDRLKVEAEAEQDRLKAELAQAKQIALEEAKQKERLERRVRLMGKLTDSTTPRTKDQIIYIVTTRALAAENKYKVGGSLNHKTMKNRIRSYQTGTTIDDPYVPVYYTRCNHYETIEAMVKDTLYGFLEVKEKELYIIHLSWLKKVVNMAIDNHTALIDLCNGSLQQIVDDTLDLEPEPIIEVPLETITLTTTELTHTQAGVVVQKKSITTLTDEEVEELIRSILTTTTTDDVVRRKVIEQAIHEANINLNNHRRNIWTRVKTIGSTINNGWDYKY